MKLQRLFAAAAAALAATFGLACGGDDAADGGASDPADKPVVAVSIPSATHGWTGGVVYWANKAKEDFGDDVEVLVQTAAGPDEQVRQIEDLMTRGVDAMVVLAFESGPLTPVAARAKQQGIYLVNVDRGFSQPVADIYLAGDNAAFGRKSAEYVVEKMKENGDTKLVMITGIPSTVDTARVEAAQAVFGQNPDVEVLDVQPGEWNREKAMTVAQAMLQKHPEIDVFFAMDDDMAEGVEQAINESGRQGIWIFGGAGKKEIVKRVMDGDETFPATITYPPGMIYAGIALAKAHVLGEAPADAADDMPDYLGLTSEQLSGLAGGDGQQEVTLDVFLVTPDNASSYYFPDSNY